MGMGSFSKDLFLVLDKRDRMRNKGIGVWLSEVIMGYVLSEGLMGNRWW